MGSGGGGKSSGGATSGKTDYPKYMKELHKQYMAGEGDSPYNTPSVNVGAEIDTLYGHSPYMQAAPYDPSTLIAANQTEFGLFETALTNMDAQLDWEDFFDTVVDRATRVLGDDDDDIEDVVAEFRRQGMGDLAEAEGALTAQLADIGAVHTSATAVGISLLNDSFNKGVGKFRAELLSNRKLQRTQFILSSIDTICRMHMFKVQTRAQSAQLQSEINRLAIVAYGEQYSRDLDLEVKDSLWNISLFQYGANMLAAISGAALTYKSGPGQDDHSQGPSMLGGGIGAILGGAAGYIAGGSGGGLIGASIGSSIGGMF